MKKAFLLSVPATLIASMPVLATEGGGSGTANSAVVTAMQTTANDMMATGSSIIPIALTVVGLALVVVFGIRIFKKVVGK